MYMYAYIYSEYIYIYIIGTYVNKVSTFYMLNDDVLCYLMGLR